MLGILVILIFSYGLLYIFEKKITDSLGLIPYPRRILQFLTGLLFISFINLFVIFIESLVKSVEWKVNNPIQIKPIFQAAWYHLKSALTEDLVYRGAILYILIRKIGPQKAMVISAIAFGIYHWFSYGIFGAGIIPMTFVFIITGLMGYVWAYTFYKTKSILMPLGFHMGWNLVSALFYENQPFGQLVFTETSRTMLSQTHHLLFAIFTGLFPAIITFLFVRYMVKSTPSPALQRNPLASNPHKH